MEINHIKSVIYGVNQILGIVLDFLFCSGNDMQSQNNGGRN